MAKHTAAYRMGVVWSAVNAAASVALPFGLLIFFARHLSPSDVGTIMFAVALVEIIKAFGLPGLYEALLQQSENRAVYHQTALTVLLLAGSALFIIYVAIIAAINRLVPDIAPHGVLLDVIGLRIVFDLATIQPQAAMAQILAYRRLALRAIIGNLGAGAIGVCIAIAGQPLAGLATYMAGQSVLGFLTTVLGHGTLATPRFHRGAMAEMLPEAAAASVIRLVSSVNNYLDQIILAWSIGSQLLAYFNLAKRVEMTFITASSSFSGILFQPTFSVTDNDGRRTGLLRALAVLGLICGVPCVFFVTNAEAVVSIGFGPNWLPAADIAAILAVGGFIRALGSIHGALLSVSGGNQRLLAATTVSATSGMAIVVASAPFGLAAVAVGLAIKNACVVAWMVALTRSALVDPIKAYIRGIFIPVGLMVAASLAAGAASRHIIQGGGLGADLAMLTASAMATVSIGLICFGPTIVQFKISRRWTAFSSASPVAPR